MNKVAVTPLLLALVAGTGLVQADEHTALEEENAKLRQMVSSLSTDRSHLQGRLRRAIANAKSTKGELNTQLTSALEDRNLLRNRLRRAIANAKLTKGELKTQLTSSESESDVLRNRLRRAIANAKSTKGELKRALKENVTYCVTDSDVPLPMQNRQKVNSIHN